MKLSAYVLAADPTWLRTSITSYYDVVDRLVVSYDVTSRGWTGAPIDVAGCLAVIADLDVASKCVRLPGTYSNSELTPTEADTRQRQDALRAAGTGADWVLQIDTDEVLTDVAALQRLLVTADERGLEAVEWPMRVLYRRLRDGRFLQVTCADGGVHYEYPGPIAVRPEVTLTGCRRSAGAFLRPLVHGDTTSLQVVAPTTEGEQRLAVLTPEQAIWHNSWGRSPRAVRRKIASWGHNEGLRSRLYFATRWLPAPLVWRVMRDFHPFSHGLWPRLAPAPPLPFAVDPRDAT